MIEVENKSIDLVLRKGFFKSLKRGGCKPVNQKRGESFMLLPLSIQARCSMKVSS